MIAHLLIVERVALVWFGLEIAARFLWWATRAAERPYIRNMMLGCAGLSMMMVERGVHELLFHPSGSLEPHLLIWEFVVNATGVAGLVLLTITSCRTYEHATPSRILGGLLIRFACVMIAAGAAVMAGY
jgi:hypothetical protein